VPACELLHDVFGKYSATLKLCSVTEVNDELTFTEIGAASVFHVFLSSVVTYVSREGENTLLELISFPSRTIRHCADVSISINAIFKIASRSSTAGGRGKAHANVR